MDGKRAPSVSPSGELTSQNPADIPSRVSRQVDYDEKPIGIDHLDLRLKGLPVADAFIEKFSSVLRAWGAPPLVIFSARQNVRRLCIGPEGDETFFASRAKKFCEQFSARLFGTEHEQMRLVGALERWLGPRLFSVKARKAVSRYSCSLAESLFACKAVMGYASERAVLKSQYAHAAKVDSASSTASTGMEVRSALLPLLDRLSCRLREKFEVFRIRRPAKVTGSTFSKRAVGGKQLHMVRTFEGCHEEGSSGDIMASWRAKIDESPLLRLPIRPVDTDGRARFDHVAPFELRGPDITCLQEEPSVRWVPEYVDGTGQFRYIAQEEYPRTELQWTAHVLKQSIYELDSGKSDDLHVTTVSEAAFKLRTVTSGVPACATVVREFQQDVYAAMELECPTFRSLQGQIDATHVNSVLGPSPESCESSDFAAASDDLSHQLSHSILTQLSQGFVGQRQVLDDNGDKTLHYGRVPLRCRSAGKALDCGGGLILESAGREDKYRAIVRCDVQTCAHPLCFCRMQDKTPAFPTGDRRGFHSVKTYYLKARKREGQLMGQGTSFLLLCLINMGCSVAAFIRDALRRNVREYRRFGWRQFRECASKVLINGDDRLARSSPQIEKDFWAIAGPIGLRKSPGKSHTSSKFAVINSQRYVRVCTGGRPFWQRIDVLRPGLVFGIPKLASDVFRPEMVVTPLFGACPRWIQGPIIALFLTWQGQALEKNLAGRDLFAPVWLGGLGQVKPDLWKSHMSFQARAIATRLLVTQPYRSWVTGPQQSYAPLGQPVQAPWAQVGDVYDAGDVAHELKSFEQRIGFFKLLSQISRETLIFWCCGRSWPAEGKCRLCSSEPKRCPERVQKLVRRFVPCTECRDPWDPRIVRDDCSHACEVREEWAAGCRCHGRLTPLFRLKTEKILDESQIRAMSRGTLTLGLQTVLPGGITAAKRTASVQDVPNAARSRGTWLELAAQGSVPLPPTGGL